MNPVTVNSGNAAEVARAVKDGAIVGPSSVRRSPSIAKLAVALCSAQAEIENPHKNKQNPHLKNWYADITAVLKAVIPVFTKHRLAVTQLPCELDGEPAMLTLVLHESGEWLETVVKIRPVKMDPQSVGSAQSYARRYALQALAGVAADEDDDGNAASRPAEAKAGPPVADRVADAIRNCKSRDELAQVWKQYERDRDAGRFSSGEATGLEAAFKAAGSKFPKPAA